MIQINDFIDYHKPYSVTEKLPLFNKLFCYIVENYEQSGIALYVGFREGSVYARFADWNSTEIDMKADKRIEPILHTLPTLVTLLKASGIKDICLYFSGPDLILVDAMVAANKFMGPGMLRDVFGKTYKTQTVREIAICDDDKIKNSKGCILKPSRFRFVMENDVPVPLYGLVDG